ncbi:CGNR zinc finger domain-containing protein [Streptosporangium roseum]|uniref:CGNR zinc finger domain-containing protein n=1 Tax=Streptosporangium roseum TaxID=2001 RepID=UPI0031E769CD
MTVDPWRITGQTQIDSYVERHVQRAALLVNELTVDWAHGRQVAPPDTGPERRAAIQEALTAAGLPRSESLSPAHADRLAVVAARLRPAFGAGARTESMIEGLNQLLVRHAAVPNLHGHPDGPPVLAFHRADASLVDAWTADAATALAMVIGVGQGARLRSCEATNCERAFFDTTRNASRRFCGLSCQNRAKASAYRLRRAAGTD